jgi:hypothetical protein
LLWEFDGLSIVAGPTWEIDCISRGIFEATGPIHLIHSDLQVRQ